MSNSTADVDHNQKHHDNHNHNNNKNRNIRDDNKHDNHNHGVQSILPTNTNKMATTLNQPVVLQEEEVVTGKGKSQCGWACHLICKFLVDAIVKIPTSDVLIAYLAHVTTTASLAWRNMSQFSTFELGNSNIVALFLGAQAQTIENPNRGAEWFTDTWRTSTRMIRWL